MRERAIPETSESDVVIYIYTYVELLQSWDTAVCVSLILASEDVDAEHIRLLLVLEFLGR